MRSLVLKLALALLVSSAFPAAAQWQVPSGAIPVGKGQGFTGFNTVGGSAGAGAKCLLDTTPPSFGLCPVGTIVNNSTALSGFTDKFWLYNKSGVISQVPNMVVYITQSPYNAACDGSTDDTSAIQAAITALPTNGGVTLAVPIGKTCVFTGALDFKGKTNFIFGNPLATAFNAALLPTRLVYSGANIPRAMDFRDTINATVYGLAVLNTTAAMTGYLIDAGGTVPGTTVSTGFSIKESSVQGNNGSGASGCLNISEAQVVSVERVRFGGCQPSIHGQTTAGATTSVSVTIKDVIFGSYTGISVTGCGDTWTFINAVWEPDVNGRLGGYDSVSGPCKSTTFINPWFGDVTTGSGIAIKWKGSGLTVIGGRISANAAASNVGIQFAAASDAVSVRGMVFENLLLGIDLENFVVNGLDIKGNFFSGVTTKIAFATNATGIALSEGNSPSTSFATSAQMLIGQSAADAAWKTLSGDVTNDAAGVTAVGTNKITNSMIRQSGALAVVGRSANSTGNVADIQATAGTGAVLRENGSTLGFGQINTKAFLPFGTGFACGTIAQATTTFTGWGTGCVSTTEASWQTPSPFAMTLVNLTAKATTAPAAGQTITVTLRVNGADSALTCTITGTGTTCTDNTHSVAVVQSDLLDMKFVTSATTGAINGVNTSVIGISASP